MKKPLLNEEITKMRKIMGLNENENPYFDSDPSDGDIDHDDETYHKANILYDKGLEAYSEGDLLKADRYYKEALKAGSWLGWTEKDLPPYEKSGGVNEGSRTDKYDDSHGSPFDRGHSDAYYGRSKNPHRWVDGDHDKEVELTNPSDIEAYHAGYDSCTDSKDYGGLDEIAESEISEGQMQSGVYYDTTVAHEIRSKVGDLHKIAPYVLELGDKVYEDISGKVSVYDGDKLVEKFADVEAFLVGIKYGATPI